MHHQWTCLAVAAAFVCFAFRVEAASLDEIGALACVTDKWEEKEIAKGHKIVAAASRCVVIPDDPAAPKSTEACTATYEYLPDGSWKAKGQCNDTYVGGATKTITFEEGSHMKEYTYTNTGGAGKFEGAGGGGTYTYENLTDTLSGGRFKGKMELP